MHQGFIDTHIHATQTSSVSAYGEKLLTWLDNYVFPSEVAFNSEKLYNKWHGVNRSSYALTPRFALSCTDETLGLCREFMESHPDSYVQSHLCENINEIADTVAKFQGHLSYPQYQCPTQHIPLY